MPTIYVCPRDSSAATARQTARITRGSANRTYTSLTCGQKCYPHSKHIITQQCSKRPRTISWRRGAMARRGGAECRRARHDLISASSLASDVNRYDVLYMNRMLRVCCIYSMGIQPGILVARIQLRLYELATVCTQRLGSGVLYARIVNVLIHFGTADAQSTRVHAL